MKMWNLMACISKNGKKAKAFGHEQAFKELEHSERSFKNLQSLKRRKSNYLRSNEAKNRGNSYRNLSLLANKIVPVSNLQAGGEQRTEEGGIVRVKMVLTKKEVADLLSMLRSAGHGGNLEQNLRLVNEGSDRIGWSPSLQSIPESENCSDE